VDNKFCDGRGTAVYEIESMEMGESERRIGAMRAVKLSRVLKAIWLFFLFYFYFFFFLIHVARRISSAVLSIPDENAVMTILAHFSPRTNASDLAARHRVAFTRLLRVCERE